MRFLLAFLVSTAALAVEIPDWLPRGLLHEESRSTYKASGLIDYIDRSGNSDRDIGPFQMTEVAFRRVSRPGEDWRRIATDTRFADTKARAYMLSLYEHEAKHDWHAVAAMWNVGPTGYRSNHSRGDRYAERVRRWGTRPSLVE